MSISKSIPIQKIQKYKSCNILLNKVMGNNFSLRIRQSFGSNEKSRLITLTLTTGLNYLAVSLSLVFLFGCF